MAEIAPALAKLMAPLRRLRMPVDEWAVTHQSTPGLLMWGTALTSLFSRSETFRL
jgi:hypothetical protein